MHICVYIYMIVKVKKHFKKYFGLVPSSVIYIYIYIYSLRKSNNYSLKSAQYNSVIILWEEDDAK